MKSICGIDCTNCELGGTVMGVREREDGPLEQNVLLHNAVKKARQR